MARRAQRTLGLAAGFVLLATVLADPAVAEMNFGVRAGAYLEDSDPFVGLELLVDLGRTRWSFDPNVEFVFANERDRIAANLDFVYQFMAVRDLDVWAGGGPAVINVDTPRGDDTDLGFDLVGGVGWHWEGISPYAQLKVVLADDSELVAAVGIRF